MKKLYFLALLFAATLAQSQIVTIPDPFFKADLLTQFDTNQDGQIQVSEALSPQTLWIGNMDIVDLTGIQAFTNLTSLNIESLQINALNLNALTNLTQLSVSSTEISSLTITALTNLESLTINHNDNLMSLDISPLTNLETVRSMGGNLNALDLSTLPNLGTLQLDSNNITQLNFHPQANLFSLQCMDNPITALDLAQHTNLYYLNVASTGLTALNVSALTNLINLEISYSGITSINLSSQSQLETLGIAGTPMTSINLNSNTALKYLTANDSNFTTLDLSQQAALLQLTYGGDSFASLDLSPLNNLSSLWVIGSPQTTLDFSSLANLTSLTIQDCAIETISVSNNPALMYFSSISNPNLTYVDLKTGHSPSVAFQECPVIEYVCADEENIFQISQYFDPNNGVGASNNSNAQVNSYCSFTPGGLHNTISGTMKYDFDSDGCSAGDTAYAFFKVKIADGANQGIVFANEQGHYTAYAGTGTFTITPEIENPDYFVITPPNATVNFANSNSNNQTQNFCLLPNGVHPDVEISVISGNAIAGFYVNHALIIKNKGNQVMSGFVSFDYDDSVLNLTTANPTVLTNQNGMLSWAYDNLQPFETRIISIVFDLNSPMETPAVYIGDQLEYSADISPETNDLTPLDNHFKFTQTVVGSFDPNDKQCSEGSAVAPNKIGDYLHYVINFENTGNFPAQNVVVADVIDPTKFDINTLQIVHTSHPMTARISGDKAEFVFEDIQLQAQEHGHIAFKVKTKNTLTVGTTVTNIANIFFDYNFPIETNSANTTFQALSSDDFKQDNSIVVSPNPVSDVLHVKANSEIKSIQVYDIQGRLVMTQLPSMTETVVEMKQSNSGIYFVKVVSGEGMSVQKIVKR
ncbi:MAG: T9SS type A sorting domain-containing protein [Flavobacterium sp.]|uniref:DUF7619 domain-containing protein n=1 Tax=Flavobacterium sp. TaxID=239 RepID=UPI0011F4F487|nr:T9SS type A sorting domain-containing protein [Flavobacterium sp.]RZJ64180.1 MAG: T9SS type A sorting domain-containing protein [Flavobacterium sp.]